MPQPVTSTDRRERATLHVEEKLRRVALGATRQIALHRGRRLGMWIGCGYPKSGTTWLCELMGTSLGLPVPIEYQSPVMMKSVIHAHWRYDPRLPPTVYVRRDGRDVMVSMYFFWMRLLQRQESPKQRQTLTALFERLYGPGFDPEDVRGNLPRYIEYLMTAAPGPGVNWQDHVRDWWDRPGVGHVTYEGLLADTVGTLAPALSQASGEEVDVRAVELAAERHSFTRAAAGRSAGTEDRTSFRRKGVAGDWRSHFTREAGEVFDAFAGDDLVEFGYADDRNWYLDL